MRKNFLRIHVSRAWKVLEKVKSAALTLLTSVCDRFLPSLRLSFKSLVFHNPPRTINMETSSRAFTNGPEGNLLLTLSDDNSSLQLRPKSVKNRIIPIITIITILANRQGALAALGEAHLFNYLEDVSISTSVPTKNKNKNKKKLRTISIVRYGKPWVMQRSAPNSSVVFIQVSRLILPEKKKKKKKRHWIYQWQCLPFT